MALAMILAALIASTVSFDRKVTVEEHAMERNSLAVTAPSVIEAPDVSGYIFSVLAEKDAAPYFAEDETSPKNVQKRNRHIALENGAIIGASSVPAIYDAAKNDILSGTYSYDMYAASGRELARLLSSTLLDDVSDNPYIDTDTSWFDAVITDSLSLLGGNYILSSMLTDTYENIHLLAYNRDLVDGETLSEMAKNGSFTLEKLISLKKAAEIGGNDLYPLYVSAGGGFLYGGDGVKIASYSEFEGGVTKLLPLVELKVGRFDDETAAFAVVTLDEVKTLRKEGKNVGILPLPKHSESDEYRSFLDSCVTEFVAFPRGHRDIEEVSYIAYRLAFLSEGYMLPSYYEDFSEDDWDMLRLIADNTVTELSCLFGYGDINGLVTDAFFGRENRLHLEYYNRKTLYEKAFEIIQTRINKEH